MRRVKTAVIGTGFMGKVHSEAIRRLGTVDIVAVPLPTAGSGRQICASHWHRPLRPGTTENFWPILPIEAVHVCTPNALHYPVSKAALEAGKAVLCEKPLSMSVKRRRTWSILRKAKTCRTASITIFDSILSFNKFRRMIEAGDFGDILVVQEAYSQDWLLYDTDYNWRIERPANGPLRVVGDIGSHWMDLVQHLTGQKITALCADLQILHKTRKKPKKSIQTFAGKTLQPEDYERVPIDTEDFGAVLVHLGDRAPRSLYRQPGERRAARTGFRWRFSEPSAV